MRILVSNDDGVTAPGIRALVDAVKDLGEVWVVAPHLEQSGASHSLSLHRPLRLREVDERWYSVDGTPADCVYLALYHLMKEGPPDLVLSGINMGPNLAQDVFYSGTVAAAREASLMGLPAIAFSLVQWRKFDFSHAAAFARKLVAAVGDQPLPPRTLLNVNVPAGVPNGHAITKLGRHNYGSDVIAKEDPRGRPYYWIGGTTYSHESLPGSDTVAIHDEKKISVTPLALDLTDVAGLEALLQLKL